MHELSIAGFVLDVALANAEGRRITRVELVVGRLRQVAPDALTFAFDLLARGTAAEGAVLAIEAVAIEGKCRSCGVPSPQAGLPLRCPVCGGLDVEVVHGEELSVQFVELADTASSWVTPER